MSGLAFTISVKDLITGPAKRMRQSLMDESRALLDTNKQVVSLEKSIVGLEAAQHKAAALGNVDAYRKASRDLGMLRTSLQQTDRSGVDMAKNLAGQAEQWGESASALGAYAGVAGVAAIAVGKLAKATAGLVLAGAEFTLESVQEKRAAQELFRAMAGGKEAGDQLFAMMEDLATKLPQTKDQLTAWSKEFMAMGILKQDALRTELTATASAAALMGDTGVDAFTNLTRKITEAAATSGRLKLADKQLAALAETGANVSDVASIMGVSANKLAKELKAGTVNARAFGDALNEALIKKGRGPLERMFASLDVMKAKFKESIGDMFEDVDVTPFTDAMRGLLEVFSQAEPSGQAMKAGLAGFFTQFFKWAATAVTIAKHMFLQLIIWALKAYIALKPYKAEIMLLVKGLLVVAAVITGTLVVALGLLAGALAVIVAPIALGAGLALKLYEAFETWGGISGIVSAAGDAVVNVLESIGKAVFGFEDMIVSWAADTASNLIGGLVTGIENGADAVVSAMKNLAKGAIKSFEKTMGIASDSKVMIRAGGYTGSGFIRGVRASNDNARAATQGLAQAAIDGAARGVGSAASTSDAAPVPSGKSGGGVVVNVAPGAIVINGATGDVTELTEHAISLIFEKIALSQGVDTGVAA